MKRVLLTLCFYGSKKTHVCVQANGAELGWILGMIINATNELPPVTSSNSGVSHLTSVFYTVLFFWAALLGVAYASAMCLVRKQKLSNYLDYIVIRDGQIRPINYGSTLNSEYYAVNIMQ